MSLNPRTANGGSRGRGWVRCRARKRRQYRVLIANPAELIRLKKLADYKGIEHRRIEHRNITEELKVPSKDQWIHPEKIASRRALWILHHHVVRVNWQRNTLMRKFRHALKSLIDFLLLEQRQTHDWAHEGRFRHLPQRHSPSFFFLAGKRQQANPARQQANPAFDLILFP